MLVGYKYFYCVPIGIIHTFSLPQYVRTYNTHTHTHTHTHIYIYMYACNHIVVMGARYTHQHSY